MEEPQVSCFSILQVTVSSSTHIKADYPQLLDMLVAKIQNGLDVCVPSRHIGALYH
jgi:hypothetical protein